MITASLVLGGLGLLATWAVSARLARRTPPPGPTAYWVLGLAGPLPAWISAFVALLGPSVMGFPGPVQTVAFIGSATAGLLGVILSDAAMARDRAAGRTRTPRSYWLLGTAATAPAWGIALIGLAASRP
jgi:hypothetical protein